MAFATFDRRITVKIHQLRDFLAIVEKQNISTAAKFLGIAQPSLSRSVQQLEKELGAPLFQRHTRGVVLTETGAVFSKRAGIIMRELERAREEVSQLQGQVQGSLSIGISGVSHQTLLKHALVPFQKRYPLVRLNLLEGSYPIFETRLKDGAIDLYVGPTTSQMVPPELKAEQLFHPPRVVLGRKGHPLAKARSLKDLLQADWLTTSITDRATAEFSLIFEEHGLPPPRLSIRASSVLTMVTALTCSDVLTITSGTFSDLPFLADSLAAIPVREKISAPPIALIHRAGVPPTPAAEYFCDMIRRAATSMAKRYPLQSGGGKWTTPV